MIEYFSANSRLLSEILSKYRDTYVAFCELLNNSLQAKAEKIELKINQVARDEIDKVVIRQISVRDNGTGVSSSEFHDKILNIATTSKLNGKGIGRFSAFQLGSTIEIETVAFDNKKECFTKSKINLSIDITRNQKLEDLPLDVEYFDLKGEHHTYYQVSIFDFYDEQITSIEKFRKISPKLLVQNLPESIFQSYPNDIINRGVVFEINGNPIDFQKFIIDDIENRSKDYVDMKGEKHNIGLSFLHYRSDKSHKKVLLRTENNGIKTIGYEFDFKCEIPDHNNWFIYVDSTLLDENTDIYRNLLIKDMHNDEESFIIEIKKHIDDFFYEKYKDYFSFKAKLLKDEHYPYKNKKPTSDSKEFVFNQISYYVEQEFHILQRGEKIKKIIYPLIDKAINNGNFEDLLKSILHVNDKTLLRFKDLIERSEIEDVIEFAQQVAERNQFLDLLHEIVYGTPSKVFKERSQLHKIVEKHLWIFGEEYSNSPNIFSDKNLENNLNALRNEYFEYDLSEEDENLLFVEDEKIRDITDLFFYYERPYNNKKREVTIVELKSPRCRISDKELSQVRKYRFGIEKKGVFSKGIRYRILLISSEITDFAKSNLEKDPDNPYLLEKSKDYDIEVMVIKWADIIRLNKEKLSYLGNNLKTKDRNLREFLETEFPEINIKNLDSVLV